MVDIDGGPRLFCHAEGSFDLQLCWKEIIIWSDGNDDGPAVGDVLGKTAVAHLGLVQHILIATLPQRGPIICFIETWQIDRGYRWFKLLTVSLGKVRHPTTEQMLEEVISLLCGSKECGEYSLLVVVEAEISNILLSS